MANYERQNVFKEKMRKLKDVLFAYGDRRGITGDTYSRNLTQEEKDDFRCSEVYDRVQARKIFEHILGCSFLDWSLEDRLDGEFCSGGTWIPVEIKARHYDVNDYSYNWEWIVDPEKWDVMKAEGAWLLYLFPSSANPLDCEWALWNTNVVEPVDYEMKCDKSYAIKNSGLKLKKDKGWYLKDAMYRGTIKAGDN